MLVVGELRRGVESIRRRDSAAAASLDRWLETLVAAYADRILAVTSDVAAVWGRFDVPDPLPVVDSLIAATAHVHDLVVVTRNTSDIARTGVPFIDPFAPTGG